MRFWCVTGLLCLVAKAFGAEPEIQSLPRIPPTEPKLAVAKFAIKQGFETQLAAAEPEVVDPIAMSFDEFGRLFVVEMRDYSERRDERMGRIRLLEDSNGDGIFEKSSIYAEGLPWPTAVTCYKGGIFVGSTPDIIYFKDTNGDGKADFRQVIFTGFGNTQPRLNVQQLLNSFQWGMDGRIHGAAGMNGGRITTVGKNHPAIDLQGGDFSFDPASLDFRVENGGGQYGMTFDTRGRKFVSSNSSHIRMHMFEREWLGLNSFYSPRSPVIDIPADGPAAEVFRISPDEPWRVIRTEWRVKGLVPGPIEGGGRPSGYFTAATGITIYKGDAFGQEFVNDAFIADCGSNLIHRKKLYPKGAALVAVRPPGEERVEFIASPDNWFRPVTFANSPDGTLFVADMYRETIEHPWSLPPNLKKHVDLNSGNDRGRIYRISPKGFKAYKRELPRQNNPAQLIAFLNHANGWHRETAARLIAETINPGFQQLLRLGLNQTAHPEGRIRILYLLDSQKWLTEGELSNALADKDGGVREHALKLIKSSQLLQGRLTRDPDPRVRMQFGLTAAKLGASPALLAQLAQSSPADIWVDEATLISAKHNPLELASALSEAREPRLIPQLCAMAAQASSLDEINAFLGRNSTNLALAAQVAEGLRRRGKRIENLAFGRQTLDFAKIAAVSVNNPQRLAAIALLAEIPWEEAAPLLNGLLEQQNPIQNRAMIAFAEFPRSEVAQTLLNKWDVLEEQNKRLALELLVRREEWAVALLQSSYRTYLSAPQRQALQTFPSPRVSQMAKTLFAPSLLSTNLSRALALTGDARSGGSIFTDRCLSCHRAQNAGFNLGPDLLSVRSNGKEAVLRAIIEPNLEVSPAFIQYSITTREDEVLTGILSEQTTASITIKGPNGWTETVARPQVVSISSSNKSMMPEGLLEGLTSRQVADLLEFIMTLK